MKERNILATNFLIRGGYLPTTFSPNQIMDFALAMCEGDVEIAQAKVADWADSELGLVG